MNKRGMGIINAIIIIVIIIGSVLAINLVNSLSGVEELSGKVTNLGVNNYYFKIGETFTIYGKKITLENVGSTGSIALDVGGMKEVISIGNTEMVNGINIRNIRSVVSSFKFAKKPIFGAVLQITPSVLSTSICNQNKFSMAFIVLAREDSEITPEIINFLNDAKIKFSEGFSIATNNLAYMDTSYQIIMIIDDGTLLYGSNPYYDKIMKEFYKNNPDKFDFVTIYPTFDIGYPAVSESHFTIKNDIKGIGLKLYGDSTVISQTWDKMKNFGSNGKLMGINAGQTDINRFINNQDFSSLTQAFLHETGHQWCCYIGDNFAKNKTSKLEIKMQNMHFYRGLQSPSEMGDPMGSDNWVSNGDGTYRRENKEGIKRYHPFVLYFMGLLPKSEYSKKYQMYDAGIVGIDFNDKTAVPYKQVSVNDIISVEGKRSCV